MSTTKVPESGLDTSTFTTIPLVGSANVFTATQQIKSTDAGATAGPALELYRDSASPAAADDIGQIPFYGKDSAGNIEAYAKIKAIITDPTSTSEDGKLALQTVVAGTLASRVNVGAGLWAEGVTGGDPGAGKANFTEVQAAGVPLVNRIVQVVNTQTGAVATGTTVLPGDDTIPQNTEGDQFMTLAITPTSATNKLKIEVVCHGTHSASNLTTVALFQDSTANALAAGGAFTGAAWGNTIVFTHYMTAGTTSATTFKVRAGGGSAGTYTFNGFGSARKLGGIMASSITITEIAA